MHDLIAKHLQRVEGLKSEGTADKRRVDLRSFNQWVEDQGHDIQEMNALDIEEYFIHLKAEGYAPNTIDGRFQAVKGLYDDLAGKFDVLEDTPFDDLKRGDYTNGNTRKHDNETISYVSKEEKEQLAEYVSAPKLRNELVIRLLWQTGVRQQELADMRLTNLDREAREIRVWSKKTSDWRTVYYNASLDVLLRQWIEKYRDAYPHADDSPYLFLTDRSIQMGPTRVYRVVANAADRAGIQEVLYVDMNGDERKRITPHALRHGHAVHALKDDIDTKFIRDHLGHESMEMTDKYLQIVENDVKEAYQRFNP